MLMDFYVWLTQPGTVPMVWGAGVAVGFLLGWGAGRLSLMRSGRVIHVSEKRLEQLHRESEAGWSAGPAPIDKRKR